MVTLFNKQPHQLLAGEYCKHEGAWYGVPPDTDLLATFRAHSVVEHEDGTITVSPSILVSNGQEEWHGFLEKGVWRKV